MKAGIWIKYIYFILLVLLFAESAEAQYVIPIDTTKKDAYYLQQFTSQHGLLQNSVRLLEYDKHGFLWIVNEKGLSRFDGNRFTNYFGPPFTYVDRRISGLKNWGDSIEIEGSPEHVIKNGELKYIKGRTQNDAAFNPNKQKVYRQLRSLAPNSGEWKSYSNVVLKGRHVSVKKDHFNFFSLRQDCYYWTLSVKGKPPQIGFVKDSIEVLFDLTLLFKEIDQFELLPKGFLLDGDLYLFHKNSLLRFDENGFKSKYHLPFTNSFDFSGDTERNQVFFLNDMGSLFQFVHQNDQPVFKLILSDSRIKSVSTVLYDNDRLIYIIGTDTHGFFRARKKPMSSIRSRSREKLNNIRFAFEKGIDTIVFSSGLLFINGEEQYGELEPRGLSFKNSKNELFMAHSNSGRYDHRNSELPCRFKVEEEQQYIINYIEDKHGKMWVGTSRNFCYLKEDSLLRIRLPEFFEKRSRNELFYWEEEDEIWICAQDSIYRFSIPNNGLINKFRLPASFTNSIHFSEEGIAWINSRGGGMFAWHKDSLYQLPLDPEKYLVYSHSIREDKHGYFWISSDNGLFKVRKTDLIHNLNNPGSLVYYYYFDKTWGFPNNEFNSQGFPPNLELSDGQFGFPSFDGLVTFHPDSVIEEKHGNTIVISRIRLNGIDTVLDPNPSLDQNALDVEVEISHAFGGHINNVLMQYKIEGYHDKWLKLSEDGKIHFSKLPFGNYKLTIRKRSGFGVNEYVRLTYPFSVKRMFYETLIFRIGTALAILIVFLLFSMWRSQRAKRKRRELEAIIHHKTDDYRVLNEELKLNLAKLSSYQTEQEQNNKTKDRMVAIYMHDIRGPLRFIMTVAKKTRKAFQNMDPDDVNLSFDSIHDATKNVFQLTEKIFSWTRAEGIDFDVKLENIAVKELADEVVKQIAPIADEKKINIVNNIESSFEIIAEKNLIVIMLNNLLQNSIKYTERGQIVVGVEVINDYKVLAVRDTGTGIWPERLAALNSGNYKSTPGTRNEQGKGFGLKVIKDFMKQLDGYMQIESEVGAGTTVRLFFKS